MDKLHWEILDGERNKLLPLFSSFRDDFYLAGETALALQIGHRDSIDFDFFTKNNFSSWELFKKLKGVFVGYEMVKVQEEKDTLTVLIDEKIKVSFFTYPYDLIKPLMSLLQKGRCTIFVRRKWEKVGKNVSNNCNLLMKTPKNTIKPGKNYTRFLKIG